MYFTPTLYLEFGLAALLVAVFLWTKVEYALFLYGLALGFPDLAYPIGSTINLRFDDILIAVFFARAFLWQPAPLTRTQKTILGWQAAFLAACVLSIVVETARSNPPGAYDTARMAGCALILLALPRVLESERRIRFLLAGLMCGGIALAVQVHRRLGESGTSHLANFQQMKSAATFDTWNPNTIGEAAILLVFAAGLGVILFSRSFCGRIFWRVPAFAFAFLPAMVFVRGTTVSIAAGVVSYLLLARRWKGLLVFATALLCVWAYVRAANRQFMEDATSVNLSTGEGLSHRFDRWGMAIEAIKCSPLAGHGFGQELQYLLLIGGEGRAHDSYLSVWLELGAGGVLLFLAALFQFVRAGWSLYSRPEFRDRGALLLALMLTLGLDSLGLPALYWEKLTTIALALAVALIGVCERREFLVDARETPALAREPFPQPI